MSDKYMRELLVKQCEDTIGVMNEVSILSTTNTFEKCAINDAHFFLRRLKRNMRRNINPREKRWADDIQA